MSAQADSPSEAALAAATMRAAARLGWQQLRLADVAAEAGWSATELQRHCPDKPALLTQFHAEMDRQALAQAEPDLDFVEETAKDRLFALLMARFDAMAPHKVGLKTLLPELPGDPIALLPAGPYVLRSMAQFLDSAGLSAGGAAGVLKAKGLAAVYLATAAVWLDDDSAEQDRTMATLDKNLRRAESVALTLFERGGKRRATGGDATDGATGDATGEAEAHPS